MLHWLPWAEVKAGYYLTPSKHGDFFWVSTITPHTRMNG